MGNQEKTHHLAHPMPLPLLQHLPTTKTDKCLHLLSMCTNTTLNIIWTTNHTKVVANTQTTPLPLHNKRHIPHKCNHPSWEPPCRTQLHMAIPMLLHHKPMSLPRQTQTWHPYHHHHLPKEIHILHHPTIKLAIHWIHIMSRSWPHYCNPMGKSYITNH